MKDHGKFWVLKKRFQGFTCLFNKMVVGEFDFMELSLYKGIFDDGLSIKGGVPLCLYVYCTMLQLHYISC